MILITAIDGIMVLTQCSHHHHYEFQRFKRSLHGEKIDQSLKRPSGLGLCSGPVNQHFSPCSYPHLSISVEVQSNCGIAVFDFGCTLVN